MTEPTQAQANPRELTHEEWCRLSRLFNMNADLAVPLDYYINEWLKERIAWAALSAAAEVGTNGGLVTHTLAAWEDDLQKARAAEREACARVAEVMGRGVGPERQAASKYIAAAIRARGEK